MSQLTQNIPAVIVEEQSFIRRVYNWMAIGLGLSAFVSFSLLSNPQLLLAYLQSPLRWVLPIGELVLIFWLFARIHTFSTGKATSVFLFYAFLNGITLTPLLLQYTRVSIFSTFFVTAATFGVTSFYGYTTKKDLSSMGGLLFMGLIGIIIASLVNIFFKSPAIYWVVTYIGVGLSIGLTAYYTQQIKQMSRGIWKGHDMEGKGAIIGALMLYLAFVMMFVYLLQILGNRR
ncbi:hypothetical protein BVX98_07220 [bacterium F11]|nr:hypothetical protein BVX98_07220 [bacterium F11]